MEPLKEFWSSFKLNRGALIGLAVLTVLITIALFAPWLAPFNPSEIHQSALRIPPSTALHSGKIFLLGTDDLGRDLLSRLLFGARISLGVGFMVVLLSTIFGTLLGVLSGYFEGFFDKLIMRFVDILMSIPSILFAVVVVAILGPGLFNAVFAVSLVALPGFIRLVRASVLSEKKKQYVLVSQSLGCGHLRQAFINILPNCLGPLIVQATMGLSDGILNVAALGFLGLGAQPPIAEWGTMLSDSRAFIENAPWLVTFPGLCILILVLAINLLGDGLRDALDPKLKRS